MNRVWTSPALRMGTSISIATGLYGISFGALAVVAGLDRLQTQALSALMFTGGSQFAFIAGLGGGAGAAVGAASLLGIRNAVYGAGLNATLTPAGWRKPLMAQFTIDESFGVSMAQATGDERRIGFWTAGVGVFLCWNLFTFLGAWAGEALGDPRRFGLDGAAVAAFVGLLWPWLKDRQAAAVAVLCALTTVVLVPFAPPGIPLLLAGAVAVALQARQRVDGRRRT